MKAHKYADIFPMLEGAEADALTESMRKSGYDVRHPIVTFEGAILDGRNRFLAAKRAGVKPSFVEFNGTDPLGYVVLANVARRHLDPSQTAMVGARIRAIYDEEAKARQVAHGGTAPGRKSLEEKLPQVRAAQSRDLAGAAVGVSGRSRVRHRLSVSVTAIHIWSFRVPARNSGTPPLQRVRQGTI